jgi:hypothetical protein
MSPIPAEHWAGCAASGWQHKRSLQHPRRGPITFERRVPDGGVGMGARQRLRVGAAQAGELVTVTIDDTHLRVVHDGQELGPYPRTGCRPVARFKAYTSRQARN